MIESIDAEKCTGCGVCANNCPLDVIRISPDTQKAFIKYPEDCMTCFLCEINCPVNAVNVHPFKEVLPVVIEYRRSKSHE